MISHAPRAGNADWRHVETCRGCGAKGFEMRNGSDWARQLEHRRWCPTLNQKSTTEKKR